MGGITSRAYVADHLHDPSAAVRRVVMLGTPNSGSVAADFACSLTGGRIARPLTRDALERFNEVRGRAGQNYGRPFVYVSGSGSGLLTLEPVLSIYSVDRHFKSTSDR